MESTPRTAPDHPPITYRLDGDGPARGTYYPAVARFTDEVLAKAEGPLRTLAEGHRRFVSERGLEEPRTTEEYVFELLDFGVLWRRYGVVIEASLNAPYRLIAGLFAARRRYPSLKPLLDRIRGFVLSRFLVPFEPSRREGHPPDLEALRNMERWLEATGDFREDALRLRLWIREWEGASPEDRERVLRAIGDYMSWFEATARERLGAFTPNVGAFLQENDLRFRWREDRFACLRTADEYYLSMVGAEIMNRAFRGDFLSTERRTVLVPGCMRFDAEAGCKGVSTPGVPDGGPKRAGIRCTGCSPTCRVDRLRRIGLKEGFDVRVLPHSSDLSTWKSVPGEPSIGVVASACLAMLVQGGWELKRHGVSAQCVVLNECGCKRHWHSEGFPTQLDEDELLRVLASEPA